MIVSTQIMFVTSANAQQLLVQGWLFDELMMRPNVESDLLSVRTWSWCFDEVVSRSCFVGQGRAKLEVVPLEQVPQKQVAFVEAPPVWHRLRGDREVRFGDGGHSLLVFPLLFAPRLFLSPERRMRLVHGLSDVARKTGDYQPKQKHVQDIIDPDLCPQLIDSWKEKRLSELRELTKDRRNENFSQLRHKMRWFDSMPDHLALRKSYRWIPSRFVVQWKNDEWKVNIRSPINGLQLSSEFKEVYQNF
jgi:hypothetical protein